MKKDPIVSIITPTYNRGHLLSNCYQSLLNQTNKDFEWIVVDDGSEDETTTVVDRFDTMQFSIKYVKKENGGKHTALNAAHPYIHGQYVLILDSDDQLIPTAIDRIISAWGRYENVPNIGIVTFLKGNTEGEPMCLAPDSEIPVDILRYKRKILKINDCCEVIRAQLFLQYPFPEFPGERFLAECALWNRVAKTHKCVYVNEIIYICEYLEGGLTSGGRTLRIRNPMGGMYISNLRMSRNNYLTQRIKYGLLFVCYGFFAKRTPRKMAQESCAPFLFWGCLPFGAILYLYWKNKFKEGF